MSTLTLVRHGQASYMEADYDKLSPTGELQSRMLGHYWARHRIIPDRLFHGPSKRHRQTCTIIVETMKTQGLELPEPQCIQEFDEFDAFTVMRIMTPVLVQHNTVICGLNDAFEEGRHTPDAGRLLQKLFEAVIREWSTGSWPGAAAAETWEQFRQRVSRAVDHVRNTAARSTHTAVITSGGPIAAAVAYSLDLPPRHAVEFIWMSRNTSYSQFVFTPERFTMHSFNSIPHLEDLQLLTYR
jgi:broad specificity phosphatase PhoE